MHPSLRPIDFLRSRRRRGMDIHPNHSFPLTPKTTTNQGFFFPRSCLVVHATWSGEARFAGETVRPNYLLRSRITKNNKTKTQHNQGKARHGTQAPPGQEPGDTGPTSTTPTQGDPRSNGLALASAFQQWTQRAT